MKGEYGVIIGTTKYTIMGFRLIVTVVNGSKTCCYICYIIVQMHWNDEVVNERQTMLYCFLQHITLHLLQQSIQ
jgi:hypothetical protein